MKKDIKKLTTISISPDNYLTLKTLGGAGDSFNDVLTRILKTVRLEQTESQKVTPSDG